MDELFVPTRKDLSQYNALCAILASESALEFRKEFRDEQKAAEKYLKAANGSKSMARGKVKRAEWLAGHGIDTSNSISESLHASSTRGLKLGSTIRLDHCAAEGQMRANDDFG